MKYIDAEQLIAEIERHENTAIDAYNPLGEDADFWHGKVVACEDLKTLVTSLRQEQQEVDIKKIINDYFKDWKFDDELDIMVKPNNYSASFSDLRDIAKHFYELGLNAKQEQPVEGLEEEIKRFLSNATKMNKGEWRGKYSISDIGFRAVARHFYALGLNAR